ncbi:MAG: DNA recombination protein RmuC [Microgenomates group bacterium]
MEVTTLTLIIVFFLLGFMILILKFFKDDLKALKSSVDSTKDTINSSLQVNTRDINDRLLRATEVIGELKREAGAFSEVSRSMKDLQDYLRSPKLRGNIGEMVLKDLISQMFPVSSYKIQHTFKSGVIVDAIIKTDAGLLPIDSKFPMENFQKMMSSSNKTEQETLRKSFTHDIKLHITAISKKYILPAENTLDFALMYIPSESVFYEVASSETLMSFARDSRVYPVSPNTLYAALQTILLSFEGKKIEQKAKDVFKLMRGIQKDFGKTADNMNTLGSHLTNAYNKFSDVQSQFNSIGQKLSSTNQLTGDTEPEKLLEK